MASIDCYSSTWKHDIVLERVRKSGVELAKQIVRRTPLSPIIKKKFYYKYKTIVGERHPIQNTETSEKYSLVRLGSEYGGWEFVDEEELYNSTIISAGLGRDASFDIEFIQKYDSDVIVIDPTPQAVDHFKKIIQSLGDPKTRQYNQSGEQPINAYELSNIDESQLSHIKKALYNKQTEIEFYKPEIESHVSHSIINWQNDYSNDSDYIEVQADTVTSVIDNQNISEKDVPLIKLDIEGAEIEVIEQMIDYGFTPKQILVEFDELHNPSDKAFDRVDRAHNSLLKKGYELIHTDGIANFLYYREDN